MRRKEKQALLRIIISAAILTIAVVLAHFNVLPTLFLFGGFDIVAASLFLIPYLIIGWDILWKAVRNIARGQVFDENFLMAVATVGAILLAVTGNGDYTEAIAVMLFYQIGELFQSYAVGKSRRSIS
jgi:Cd2+/Zn2+-exporting ATPase